MFQKTEGKSLSLEAILQNFIRHTDRCFLKTSNSLLDLKSSMQDFKEELQADRNCFQQSVQETLEEMCLSREHSIKEIQAFKEEMRASRAELNKKWEDLAQKRGSLVEDIMAPNIIPLSKKYFDIKESPEDFAIRRKKKHTKDPSMRREFDIMAVYKDKIILNETKSNYKQEHIDDFANLLLDFFDFFPEYIGKELIPIFAALYIDKDGIKYATQKGIYVMASKGSIMDILNFYEISGQQFIRIPVTSVWKSTLSAKSSSEKALHGENKN